MKNQKTLFLLLFFAVFMLFGQMVLGARSKDFGVDIGAPAPAFTLPDRYGKMVSLSDFAGKKVILFYWVSWCVCREQLPLLQEFKNSMAGKDFEVVSVSIDAQGARYASPLADVAGVRFPVLLDRRADTARSYHYSATPATFLIDEAGIVRGQYPVDFDLADEKTKNEIIAFIDSAPAPKPASPPPALEEQIKQLEQTVRDAPENADARRRLAGLLMDSGRVADAIPQWEAIVSKKKRSCEDIFSLGAAYFSLGNKEEAGKKWRLAAKCDQTNYIYFRTAQSNEDPNEFYTKEKMKHLFFDTDPKQLQ